MPTIEIVKAKDETKSKPIKALKISPNNALKIGKRRSEAYE